MSLKKYLSEIESVASETGLYIPLASHIFGTVLGYPAKHRIVTKSGKNGIPDIRLYSQEDNSQWAVAEVKFDDDEIRLDAKRKRIWNDQILDGGYIEPDCFYVMLCAPRTFYICDLDGNLLETVHIDGDKLLDPKNGGVFPLSEQSLRDRLHIISYAASLERRQFEAFRLGELKSGHIELSTATLPQLQIVFSDAIDRLRDYSRFCFGELRVKYDDATAKVKEIDKKLADLGSGAIKTKQKLQYDRRTIRAENRLAFHLFEDDYERFKHDQTYAGTEKEKNFEDIFCTNTAYVVLSRLIFVRICEDVGLTTRKISNSGIAVWRKFVHNIKDDYQDLLEVAFEDVRHVYSSLFEASVFDWFGNSINGKLHDILERILFRLNAFSFKGINRDVLGSMYQYFRPKMERKRLGEYYTPVQVVDYILARTGVASDPDLMEKRILDPACGSFTFGVRAMNILLRVGKDLSNENRIELVRRCVHGYDINPFSVFLAHLSLLFGLLETYLAAKNENPDYEIVPMSVTARNSLTFGILSPMEIGGGAPNPVGAITENIDQVDYVVGNPPFVRNERLPEEDRQVLSDLFGKLAVRNTDLSVFFLYVSLKYFAKDDGSIGMVAPIAIANTQMAAYLRGVLKDFEISELVSLEWCAKKLFPGADIIPMLIFVKKKSVTKSHRIRLVRGLAAPEELTLALEDPKCLKTKSSEFAFSEWLALSRLGDWCLDVSEEDVPILQKLNAATPFRSVAHCSFAVKSGNDPKFLRSVEDSESKKQKKNEARFVKGQHIAAFHTSLEVDEYANLENIDSAEDSSIWGDLDFYRTNRGHSDGTGFGREDYEVPHKLSIGLPSDTLVCLVPEISVTLAASVVDPLSFVANNSAMVVVPTQYSAYCLSAVINSRISRYYSFLTLRSAILLRRRTTWFPRALKALPMPQLNKTTAGKLHALAAEASSLSDSVAGTEVEAYLAEAATVKESVKAVFLGLKFLSWAENIDRDELIGLDISGSEISIGGARLSAKPEILVLLRVALLATDNDEFTREDIANTPLPLDATAQSRIAEKIRNFRKDLRTIESRVHGILEEIDEIVASGLKLSSGEHATIKSRSAEFPLSVTVERPRFAWSADRKQQARRIYAPGERFR